jgi:hypothetical protein
LKRFEDAATSLPYPLVLLKCIQNVLFSDLSNTPEGFPVFFTQLVIEKSASVLEQFVSALGGDTGSDLRREGSEPEQKAKAFFGVVLGSMVSLLPTLLMSEILSRFFLLLDSPLSFRSLSSASAQKSIVTASPTFTTSTFKLLSAMNRFNAALRTVFPSEEILKGKREYLVELEKVLAKLLLSVRLQRARFLLPLSNLLTRS